MNKLVNWFNYSNSKFHTSCKYWTDKNNLDLNKSVKPNPVSSIPSVDIGKSFLTPNGLDKIILLWAKKYKSKAEIPKLVPVGIYNHARNIARIKFANYTMGIVLVACIIVVYTGKQDQKAGNTLLKRSRDWHEEIRKEHEKELDEAAASAK